MADDMATRSAEVAHSGVVSLRRELWRKHVQLRELGPDDLRYAGAATEVLDLTARLLAAEEAVATATRLANRRATVMVYCLMAGCSAAVIATVALLPGLGTVTTRVAMGAVPVLIVLIGTALLHWLHARMSARASANATEVQPALDPATGPLAASTPAPARSSS